MSKVVKRRMEQYEAFFTRILDNQDFKSALADYMLVRTYIRDLGKLPDRMDLARREGLPVRATYKIKPESRDIKVILQAENN